MSERYWITGVQLGLLKSYTHINSRETIIKEIIKNQFIGNKEHLKKLLKESEK